MAHFLTYSPHLCKYVRTVAEREISDKHVSHILVQCTYIVLNLLFICVCVCTGLIFYHFGEWGNFHEVETFVGNRVTHWSRHRRHLWNSNVSQCLQEPPLVLVLSR
jgi:hypothetical protein